METASDYVFYAWNNDLYYDYKLSLLQQNNPDRGVIRKDTSYDFVYRDEDITDQYFLWNQYDEYSKKIEFAIID